MYMIVHGSFMEKNRHTWWVMVSFPQDGVLFLTYSLLVSQGRPSVFDHFEPLMFKFWRHHETPMFHDAILGFSLRNLEHHSDDLVGSEPWDDSPNRQTTQMQETT
jgi:hypothetical protein